MLGLGASRDSALLKLDVSRETAYALDTYVALLTRWNQSTNLVGSSTLPDIWSRHILDCGQIMMHCPRESGDWVDLGTGAGLPGLIVAIFLRDTSAKVHLIESNIKKCSFLHHIARELSLNVVIHADRIERVLPGLAGHVQVVTARAVAPLPDLMDMCELLWRYKITGLFFKGQHVAKELTAAAKSWSISYSLMPSLASDEGCILRVESARPL